MNEEKGEFSPACEIEKKIVREEMCLRRMRVRASEDGVVEHSK